MGLFNTPNIDEKKSDEKKSDEKKKEKQSNTSKIEELETVKKEYTEAFDEEIKIARELEEVAGTLKIKFKEAKKKTSDLRKKLEKLRKSIASFM